MKDLFDHLEEINRRPEPFQFYTAADLWTDDHISKQMLAHHLNPESDVSSRRAEFIDQSVAWIGSHLNVGPGTRIVDFGCGPGLYANRLAKLGARVTAIDFSKRSIEHARAAAAQESLTVSYVNQDYLAFETECRYDIILMVYCDFCALSSVQRRRMLEKFHTLLAPGGSLLLDVYSLRTFEQREEKDSYAMNLPGGFWSAKRYYGFLNTFKYREEQLILDKYTIIEEARTRTIYNWLQCFSPELLQCEFKKAGFSQCELYGNVAGAPYGERDPEFAAIGRN